MIRFSPIHLFCKRWCFSSASHATNYLNSHLNFFLTNQVLDLPSLLQSHSYIITTGNADNIFISSKLISFYASLNKPNSATKVFHSVRFKDPFLWNSIIKAHFSNGNYSVALEFYTDMRLSGTLPNQFTVPMVVATCAELVLDFYGMSVHGLVSKLGLFAGNSAVGSSFVYMYAKCGCVEDAAVVFDEIPGKDVVAWTALVIGYVQNGECEKGLKCLSDMHRSGGDGERPNVRTLDGGFQACGNLGALLEGRCLHGLAIKNGIMCSHVVQSAILSMYSKCGASEEASFAFSEVVANKDLVSWTSIISVYAKLGHTTECFHMFSKMQFAGILPDGVIISCVLSVFGNSLRLPEGKAFHALILRRNYELDQIAYNALLSMYCKCGCVTVAEKLFSDSYKQDNDSWNIMFFGYSRVGMETKCLELFREMQHLGMHCDSDGLIAVISSCSKLEAIYLGRSLHCYTIKCLVHENVSVANALIDMYGKSGDLTIAWRIFCRTQRDTVTWNTLISSYTHGGRFADATTLFDKMVSEGIKPSSATLITVLSACSHAASLEKGEQIHDYIRKMNFELNLPLTTALVDMYGKCGKLEMSRKIFNSIKQKDTVAWNVMISAYGMHGDVKSAIMVFKQMEQSNVTPNELTFLAVLSACAHAGFVEEGKSLFARMGKYFLRPSLKHYACMVDLFGRSGNLHDAEALVLSMPIAPDGGIWGTLLTACKIHNDPEIGIRIAKRAIESDPENDGYYVVISDLYGSIGRWEEAERMRTIMKKKGVRKSTGLDDTQKNVKPGAALPKECRHLIWVEDAVATHVECGTI